MLFLTLTLNSPLCPVAFSYSDLLLTLLPEIFAHFRTFHYFSDQYDIILYTFLLEACICSLGLH